MKVLVTGGAGFIGSAVVRHLILDKKHQVLNYDKLTYAGTVSSLEAVWQNPLHTFVQGDICDKKALQNAIQDFGPDWIMHLAAESHVDRSISGAADFINTNIMGTFNLLEVARDYFTQLEGEAKSRFRFLHVSTDEVYGSLGDTGFFTETSPYDPSSPYSASKAASDHLARAWHRTYGMPVLLSSSSNNYGPYQFPEKLIPLTLLKALSGDSLPVYGKGLNVRDWLHVEDHANALVTILERGRLGETYNIGGSNERQNIQVVRSMCGILDELRPDNAPHDRLITFVTDRPGHDARYAIDSTKVRTELGWKPAHSFEEGLRQTILWYMDNAHWWEPLSKHYTGERLGLT